MSSLVTIVVSAGGASERMLRACLCSLERHPNDVETDIVLCSSANQAHIPDYVAEEMGYPHYCYDVRDSSVSGSHIHAQVLDRVVHMVETPLMLTLDADCFPLMDGWLDELVSMMDDKDAALAGILQPYAPPPPEMAKNGIEYRIRSQFSWENTHVACQLVAVDTLKRMEVKFSDGDDTNFGIVKAVRDAGLPVVGWKPSHCGMPNPISDDVELNRERCIVYGGGWVYHHGGGSRENQGRGHPGDAWRGVREAVLEEGGAEYLNRPGCAWYYYFDREEEVADAMVRRIMRGMQIHLQKNRSVFND